MGLLPIGRRVGWGVLLVSIVLSGHRESGAADPPSDAQGKSASKLVHTLVAPRAGLGARDSCAEGDIVPAGATLIEIDPNEERRVS